MTEIDIKKTHIIVRLVIKETKYLFSLCNIIFLNKKREN